MHLTVGQKVAYPTQGVCLVEEFKHRTVGDRSMSGYCLRVLGDNSTIFVPEENAENVGIRPIISSTQCRKLMGKLSEDFEPVSGDWKTRSREFMEKIQSGDVFEAADVLKKLTFLSHEKKLSFREQTLLEKAKFLIVSEISNAYARTSPPMESEIIGLVEAACSKHQFTQPRVMAAALH
jgi:CarD family transcriptional regulator